MEIQVFEWASDDQPRPHSKPIAVLTIDTGDVVPRRGEIIHLSDSVGTPNTSIGTVAFVVLEVETRWDSNTRLASLQVRRVVTYDSRTSL